MRGAEMLIMKYYLFINPYLQRITVALFLCLWLASCGPMSFVDISLTPEYSSVIGKQFRVKEDLWAFGIMSKIDYPKKVDYIVLMKIRIGGREVITEERLKSGFVFRVVRVLKARVSLLPTVKYIVEIVDSNKFKGYEVEVDMTGDANDGNYGLDKSVYALEN